MVEGDNRIAVAIQNVGKIEITPSVFEKVEVNGTDVRNYLSGTIKPQDAGIILEGYDCGNTGKGGCKPGVYWVYFETKKSPELGNQNIMILRSCTCAQINSSGNAE